MKFNLAVLPGDGIGPEIDRHSYESIIVIIVIVNRINH